MLPAPRARSLHGVTAAMAAIALVLQFVLVWQGQAVLDETDVPSRAARVSRYFCYFTILSNALVAATAARAATGGPFTRAWRVLRLNAVTGIVVTGVVHYVLLRPLLDLEGANAVADAMLHVLVPVLAVVAWIAAGPRLRLGASDLAWSGAFPTLYLVVTLTHGAITGWYPYPFVDVGELGYPTVLVNAAGVVALLVVLSAVVWRVEVARNGGDDVVADRSPGSGHDDA
ncbi:Pr6Pr family membrane protein [Nocardioides panacisoli]|uniref:Pr6Pr family membrane protein n=1 Tax=Nocardioides panacisoli TaxID=627624 RepID=UPI001C6367EA|nr:Pr6Pr family membrane protein [Nocardioides panacisoli]QYJ04632.1 Pr6Pr family membrane protein [Nocardioides panacisoli]